VVVEYKGVRILLEVCYDLRFPIWSRNHGDYDMILYVANWPTVRVAAWKSLLVARAIENQCYVAGVNRVGADPSNEYSGGSMVIDPYGKIIASCEDGVEMIASAEIDMEMLETFRNKFPVLNDADIR
jgi:predicted amidohydrolase